MSYYERKIQKYDAASITLAKLGLLLVLVLMAAQAFAGGTPVTVMQAGSIQTLPVGVIPFAVADEVNTHWNGAIKPQDDKLFMDKWEVKQAGDFGDCDDYVMTKRDDLLKRGYAHEAMNIVLLQLMSVESNEYHLALMVKTDQGHYLLDNRFTKPMALDSQAIQLSYRIEAIQVGRTWVKSL